MKSKPLIYIAFHKPFQVLSQFAPVPGKKTILDFVRVPEMPKAVGRLDFDSEGLILLSNDIHFIQKYTSPSQKIQKVYFAQVEGLPKEEDFLPIQRGLRLGEETFLPAEIQIQDPPFPLWERNPPIRFRKQIPTTWVCLKLKEGKNRQVRRMTAAIGYPTLRLIRTQIGKILLDKLQPGEFRILNSNELN